MKMIIFNKKGRVQELLNEREETYSSLKYLTSEKNRHGGGRNDK